MNAFKIIVGLGNPGKKYSATRHNFGFMVIDAFADDRSLEWKTYKDIADVSFGDNFVLVKPLLFMNNSGQAVLPIVKKNCSVFSDIIVVHDDMDIDLGYLRVKRGGSAGGHNGVQSIIDALGTGEFCRLRIGISRPPSHTDAIDFVLSKFSADEAKKVETVIPRATDAISVFINDGITKAMNVFNRRVE